MSFLGWQPRWFVLESGILSYYRAQEDVNNGCKGSIKMSVCDVSGTLHLFTVISLSRINFVNIFFCKCSSKDQIHGILLNYDLK